MSVTRPCALIVCLSRCPYLGLLALLEESLLTSLLLGLFGGEVLGLCDLLNLLLVDSSEIDLL